METADLQALLAVNFRNLEKLRQEAQLLRQLLLSSEKELPGLGSPTPSSNATPNQGGELRESSFP